MTKLINLLAGTGMLACCAVAASSDGDFKKFITAEIPKMNMAFNKKDVSYFEKVGTDNFTETQGGKTAKKAEAMASLKQLFSMASSIDCKYSILSCASKGNTGTVLMHGILKTTMPAATAKGKSQSMVMDMTEKQTWVKVGKNWKISSLSEAKPLKMTVNGKPMDPSKMHGG